MSKTPEMRDKDESLEHDDIPNEDSELSENTQLLEALRNFSDDVRVFCNRVESDRASKVFARRLLLQAQPKSQYDETKTDPSFTYGVYGEGEVKETWIDKLMLRIFGDK